MLPSKAVSKVASKDMLPLPSNFAKVFWNNQFKVKIAIPDPAKLPSLKNKTAIITGANTGLGFEAAKQLLTLGLSHLIVAVRSTEKGETAATKLRLMEGGALIEVWALDMESYDSIQAFVRKCDANLPRVDYVVLNAGLQAMKFNKTRATGHETTIQVNHISTILLTILLLPVLRAKSSADKPVRLTVVNSLTAHLARFPNRNERPLLPSFDEISRTPWDPSERYGVSKLLCQLFLVKLAEKVPSDSIIINMVDPGLTKGTGLAQEANGLMKLGASLFFGIAGRPVEAGAATYVDALVVQGRESHGCFLMNCEISP